jgi:methionyl-tRNA synthetase
VLYVWLDAPIGYISATKQWAQDRGTDWEKWWKGSDTRLLHFIGKDNIVFHCLIFPIVLRMHGGGFLLPHNVPANEFLNLEGNKLSTSRQWAVWVHEYMERWPGRQDELRYALASILPEFKDSEFTWKDFQDKNNNELVSVLGNFVQRVFVLCHKLHAGCAPQPSAEYANPAERERDLLLWAELSPLPTRVAMEIERFRFRDALASAMQIARAGNKYLTDTEPWKLEKTDPARVRTILFNGLRISAALSVVLEPFLPFTANRLRNMLGLGNLVWGDALRSDLVRPGMPLGAPAHLFKPIEDAPIAMEIERLGPPQPATIAHATAKQAPSKGTIAFEDFGKLDLRVGTIRAAEAVPKADKLLKLTVDLGEPSPRTVVSGIAQHYRPEQVVGKQVVVVCNLEPRKMRGVESQGMVLMAEGPKGTLHFVAPDAVLDEGSEVR